MKALVGYTFDYQNAHPEFVRLVMIENIHEAVHLKSSRAIQGLNVRIIDSLKRIIARGRRAGSFRKGLDPIDLHLTISALAVLQRLEPGDILGDFQCRHGLDEGARDPPRAGRRRGDALRRRLISWSFLGAIRRTGFSVY